jgi:hypothetical protein
MTYVFRGTADDHIKRFFDHVERARQSRERADTEVPAALAELVGIVDRQAQAEPVPTERLDEFWRTACEALNAFPDDMSAYAQIALVLAEGANDNEWYELCLRRSAIQLLSDHCPPVAAAIDRADLSDLDEEMRRVGLDQGPAAEEFIPRGLPDSHWWWHYPAPRGVGARR